MIPDTGHPNARAVRGFCPRFSFALQAAARGARGASENSSSWASTVRKHGQTGSYARSTMAPIEKTTGGTRMALQGAHQLFGDTDESSCVPDAACAPRRSGAREASDAPDVPDAACAIGMPDEAYKLKASWMLDAPSSPEVFPLGDYLADAFIAWDFYADAPIPDAPFVLRFSEGDLVAYRALDGELAVWAGAVDTSLPPASLRRDVEDCCPAWVVAGSSLARLASVLAGFSAQQKMNTPSSWKSAISVYCLRAAWFKPLSASRGCWRQLLTLRGGSAGNRGIPRRGSAGPRCSRRGPCLRPNRRIAGSCTPSPAPVPAARRRGGRSRLCRSGQ